MEELIVKPPACDGRASDRATDGHCRLHCRPAFDIGIVTNAMPGDEGATEPQLGHHICWPSFPSCRLESLRRNTPVPAKPGGRNRGQPLFGEVVVWIPGTVDAKMSLNERVRFMVISDGSGCAIRRSHWLVVWSESDLAPNNCWHRILPALQTMFGTGFWVPPSPLENDIWFYKA